VCLWGEMYKRVVWPNELVSLMRVDGLYYTIYVHTYALEVKARTYPDEDARFGALQF
jgi:hypothetical protein